MALHPVNRQTMARKLNPNFYRTVSFWIVYSMSHHNVTKRSFGNETMFLGHSERSWAYINVKGTFKDILGSFRIKLLHSWKQSHDVEFFTG